MTYEQLAKIMEAEGDFQSQTYRGFTLEVKRHYELLHLSGFIRIGKDQLKVVGLPEDYDEFNGFIQGQEWTWRSETETEVLYGFDCAHHGQLIPSLFHRQFKFYPGQKMDVYWTMERCFKVLKQVADSIMEIEEKG